MGSVLLVKRVEADFQQLAGPKLVAPHPAGPYILDRFIAERPILAHLNHPNITKLLDGDVAGDTGYALGRAIAGPGRKEKGLRILQKSYSIYEAKSGPESAMAKRSGNG